MLRAAASWPCSLVTRLWSLPSQFLTGPKILRQLDGTRGRAASPRFLSSHKQGTARRGGAPPRTRQAILASNFFLFLLSLRHFPSLTLNLFPTPRFVWNRFNAQNSATENGLCHLIRVTQGRRERLKRGYKVNLQTRADKVSGATKVFSKEPRTVPDQQTDT